MALITWLDEEPNQVNAGSDVKHDSIQIVVAICPPVEINVEADLACDAEVLDDFSTGSDHRDKVEIVVVFALVGEQEFATDAEREVANGEEVVCTCTQGNGYATVVVIDLSAVTVFTVGIGVNGQAEACGKFQIRHELEHQAEAMQISSIVEEAESVDAQAKEPFATGLLGG